MGISATDPIGPAMNRAGRMLFKPFQAGKWFTLGFCAFLASLGEGGGSNFNFPGGGGGGGGGPAPFPAPGPAPGPFPGPGPVPLPAPASPDGGGAPEWTLQVWEAFLQNAFWIVPVFAAGVALFVVVMWVRARGKFIFLEGVAYDRGAVVEPWKRLRPLANSYFRFELLLTAATLVVMTLVAVGGLLVALPDIRAQQMGPSAITAMVVGGLLLLVGFLAMGLVHAAAEDFVIPLMYLRGQMVGPAWQEFRQHILRGHAGPIAVFYLMRILLGLAEAMILFFGTCLTCCIAGLPYVSSVVFLPIHVFNRAYSLYFLGQFGSQYGMLVDVPEPPRSAFAVIMAPAAEEGQPHAAWPPPPPPPDPPAPNRDV